MVEMGTQSMSGKGALILEGLVKTYGGQKVVDNVTVSVASGEFFSLLGPSGSGKTSTLMMIAGFAAVDGGRVMLDGEDISTMTPQQRGLGMVFQNYALFPHLSVFDNVAFPLRVRKLSKQEVASKVAWALEVVRLSEFQNRLPRELSGGQQQRVALARAIVFQPQVVLMDEPLGALDKNLRYHMQVEIKEIQKQLGMTVVYVTHDQEEAMNMSDRIAIMKMGRVDQMGAPREVYEHPKSAFSAKFLGEANLLRGGILAHPAVTATYGDGLAQARAPQLFLRPERIHLSAANAKVDDAQVSVQGVVKRVSFLGNVVRHGIDIGAHELLTVDVQNSHEDKLFALGMQVYAHWNQHDARVIDD
jgi:spermidine/putrescine ABC transporter ATP-binding subunit